MRNAVICLWMILVAASANVAIISGTRAETYQNPTHGFTLAAPSGWSVLTPAEARKMTDGAFKPTASSLVFLIDDSDPDKNMNIQFTVDARRDAPTNAAARKFFEGFKPSYRRMIQQQMPDSQILSLQVTNLAGGVALEAIFTSQRSATSMKQVSIMLIVNGKAFTITCTAPEAAFSATMDNAFEPILKSLVFQ